MENNELILCEVGRPELENLESYSPYCIKVHRALQLARLPYTSRHGTHPAAHRAVNPLRQVPVLLIDGDPVRDSTTILQRIVAMAPERIDASSEAWLWEEFADTALNGFLVASRWADESNWSNTRNAYFKGAPWFVRTCVSAMLRRRVIASLVHRDVWRAGAQTCWQRFFQLLDHLESRAPDNGYWLSQNVSVADVAIYAQLRSLQTPLTPWQHAEVNARSRLRAYLERVASSK